MCKTLEMDNSVLRKTESSKCYPTRGTQNLRNGPLSLTQNRIFEMVSNKKCAEPSKWSLEFLEESDFYQYTQITHMKKCLFKRENCYKNNIRFILFL